MNQTRRTRVRSWLDTYAPGSTVPAPTNKHLGELSEASLLDYSSALAHNMETGTHTQQRAEALERAQGKLVEEFEARGLPLERLG